MYLDNQFCSHHFVLTSVMVYMCCGTQFKNRRMWRRHRGSTHGDKLFKCGRLNTFFLTASNRKIAITRSMYVILTFSVRCGISFSSDNGLRVHRCVSSTMEFRCYLCDAKFPMKDSVSSMHIKSILIALL